MISMGLNEEEKSTEEWKKPEKDPDDPILDKG